jgi:hypothetical protein
MGCGVLIRFFAATLPHQLHSLLTISRWNKVAMLIKGVPGNFLGQGVSSCCVTLLVVGRKAMK